MRAVLKGLGVLLLGAVVLLAAGAALLLMLDWDVVRGRAEALLGGALGRHVAIGDLDVDLGSTSRIHLSDVRIANADWARDDQLAEIADLTLALEVWPLLGGHLVINEVSILEPKVWLERDGEGRVNWAKAKPVGEIAAPEERDEFPTIKRLSVENASVVYRDAIRDLMTQVEVASARAVAGDRDAIEAALEGTLQGEALSLEFAGASPQVLRAEGQPYPIDLKLAFGKTRLSVAGEVLEPVKLEGLALNFELSGPSLSEIFPLAAIPLPETPPYRLKATLERNGEVWSLAGLEGRVGDSDLSGSVSLDGSGEKPFLEADLVSEKLDFDDLSGLIGAEPDADETANAEQKAEARKDSESLFVFPDTPIAGERLHAMNMDVTFEGKHIDAGAFPLDGLETRVQLTDGRVLLKPLSLAIAKGRASGEMALNAREDVPSADAKLAFEDLELTPFFKDTDFVEEMGGKFSGEVYLLGVGHSLDEIMASARGEGWIGIRDGSVSALLVEAAGLDLVEALVLVIESDARVRLRCGRFDLAVSVGVLLAKRAVVDTSDSILLASGKVDLSSETLDLQIEARAKDFSLIDAAAPVSVTGELKKPSVSIGGLDPLPFFEMGDAEDLNCDRLLSGTGDESVLELDEPDQKQVRQDEP